MKKLQGKFIKIICVLILLVVYLSSVGVDVPFVGSKTHEIVGWLIFTLILYAVGDIAEI